LFRRRPLSLRDYHRAGELLRQLRGDPEVASTQGWRGTVAKALRASEATLNKCLQFRLRYEKGDLPELKALGGGLGPADGRPGRPGQAAAGRVAAARRPGEVGRALQREVQRLNGSWRRGGGRCKERGHGLLPDLAELAALTRRWVEFHARVWAPGGEGVRPGAAADGQRG
jgi:hypothetical protein